MSQLNEQEILSFTKLLQEPIITASCTDNCQCNEACGCKKPGCCEYKCQCDGKSKPNAVAPEDLLSTPKYADIVKAFDASQLKTIADFRDLVAKLQGDLDQ